MGKIYVVNGYPGSGKTEFGLAVGANLSRRYVNFLHTSSIDPVKMVLKPITLWGDEIRTNVTTLINLKRQVCGDQNWDGVTKDDYWRKAMSDLKLKMIEKDPEVINRIVLNKIKLIPEPNVAFVDIREPENIESFKRHVHNEFQIRVETIFVESDFSHRVDNYSDLSVEKYRYDIRIENNRMPFVSKEVSTFFMKARADAFVEQEIMESRGLERIY